MTTRKCPSCGIGEVHDVTRLGRRMHFRNIPDLEIPEHVSIPTCSNLECGEDWVNREVAARIDAAMAEAYQATVVSKVEVAIGKLKSVIPQRDLERLLGLSAGYISKLKSGKETSAPLVSTLMMLAESPQQRIEELRELWKTKPKPTALPQAVFSDFKWAGESAKLESFDLTLVRVGKHVSQYAKMAERSLPASRRRPFMEPEDGDSFAVDLAPSPGSTFVV